MDEKVIKEKIENAKSAFKELNDNNHKVHAKFFEEYGIGNTKDIVNKPYERHNYYDTLLTELIRADKDKYEKIHKGTPFFFLAWTAFDLKNYEKAVFYMDATISENIKYNIDWLDFPSGKFLTLEGKGEKPWKRINDIITKRVSSELIRFHYATGLSISEYDFVNKFVKELLKLNENHSIITALYSYILEFEEREKELSLKSSQGGSMEPVLTYLFKGGLIFESLLKYFYKKNDGQNYFLIRDIFGTREFKNDFVSIKKSNANSLREIIGAIKTNDLKTAFKTTSKLRNTSGHNLVWDNIFDDPENFKKLYEQQVNAILYLIQKKFIVS